MEGGPNITDPILPRQFYLMILLGILALLVVGGCLFWCVKRKQQKEIKLELAWRLQFFDSFYYPSCLISWWYVFCFFKFVTSCVNFFRIMSLFWDYVFINLDMFQKEKSFFFCVSWFVSFFSVIWCSWKMNHTLTTLTQTFTLYVIV